MKPRYPFFSFVAALLVSLIALPAVADDLDSAVSSARGSSLPILNEAESLANASARAQASAEEPLHADLSPLLGICDSVGEVVGAGPSVDRIFGEFQSSGSHWSVITSAKWASMGTGQTRGNDGQLYISVVFCEGGVPPTTTTSTTVTTTPTQTVPTTPTPASESAATTVSTTATPASTSVSTSLKLVPFDRELCPLIGYESITVDMSESFCIF